ncbi:MAG TPA: winged helix-turn-helix domain-containing protein [Telluria sp.]|jgi:DNA-binding winged helix-turn-helix (wHTH) protein
MNQPAFQFGAWRVSQDSNCLLQGTLRRQLEPRAMDVLVALCLRPGKVVSADELLDLCWGSTDSGDNPIHKTITQLRRALGDSASAPSFIETIRKRGYRTIAAVRALDSALSGSPFRGLQTFDTAAAAIFFGRSELTAALVRSLARQVLAGRALQIVLGPSGSGKTSLIRGGLLPALASGADGLEVCASTVLDLGEAGPGQLFTALGGAMLDWEMPQGTLLFGHNADALGRMLASSPATLTALLEAALAQLPGHARVALVIDRFEAVFSGAGISAATGQQLIDALQALAAGGRVLLVLACHNDFYPRLAAIQAFMAGRAEGDHLDLAPSRHAEIAQIIRLPTLADDLGFGTDQSNASLLDDLLCRVATTSAQALPLLQFTLDELSRLRYGVGSPDGVADASVQSTVHC